MILFPLVFDLGLPWRLLLTETVVGDGVPFNRVVWHKNCSHHGCRLCILNDIVPHDIVHIDVLRCGLRGAHLRVRVRDKSECTVTLRQRGWHGLGPESKRSRPIGRSTGTRPFPPPLHVASPWLQHAAAPQRHRVCFRPHTDQNLWRQSSCMPSTLATFRYGLYGSLRSRRRKNMYFSVVNRARSRERKRTGVQCEEGSQDPRTRGHAKARPSKPLVSCADVLDYCCAPCFSVSDHQGCQNGCYDPPGPKPSL